MKDASVMTCDTSQTSAQQKGAASAPSPRALDTASAGGLDNFRAGTRTLLGEYTDHFKRQRIVDQSREELKLEGSLGNAVHCSRLDRVKVTPGQVPVMELM